MSEAKAQTLQKMNNILMNNKNEKKKNNKSKRARYMKLVKKVRPIRNILSNHRQGKITNKQRNNQLNNRVEFNKTRRMHWYSPAEREARKKNHKKIENDFVEFFQNRENIEEREAQQRARDFNAKLQKFVKNTQERKRKGKANKGGKRKTRRRRKKKKRKTKRR